MTLEFNQLTGQVQAMGDNVAGRAANRRAAVDHLRGLLQQVNTAYDDLEDRVNRAEAVQEAVRFSWLGAAPAGEPLAVYQPPPPPPEQVTVIASDGSQIYPDRHALTLYYLVNVGAIVYRHGSESRPDTLTQPTLYYQDDDIFGEQGLLVPASIVNVKRDLAEIEILVDLVPAYREDGIPILALIDGRLTLRTIDLPGRQQKTYQARYLRGLDRLQAQQTTLAAYIDRPRSSFVISLLHLADMSPESISEDTLRTTPYLGLTDADLFADLPPGQRTAVFNQRAKANIDYARAGHPVHFFYLNTGLEKAPNLVRVEIPGWVAKDKTNLDVLHSTLLRQAAAAGGYPYVLARAHELAIVTPREREALETMLSVSLLNQGQSAQVSRKQQQKDLLGSREGFNLSGR